MIFKKIITGLFFICFLNGCVQAVALLGPTYTLVNTGNIYQAGVSYESNKALKKITGKTPTENIKNFVNNKNTTAQEE
tara:strand:+ start:257 stop:490 length:234 start_codon:yes stop_codon:yes gene_type:complete